MQWSNRFIQPLIVGFLMEPARQRVCFVETLSDMSPCVTVVVVVAWRLELTDGHPKITFGNFTLNALLLYPPHAIEMSLQGRDSYISILIPQIYWACEKSLGGSVGSVILSLRHKGVTTTRTVCFLTPVVGNLNNGK